MKEELENQRFIYEFGKFVLDPQEKTFLAGGQLIHLPAKEFETLLLLVENNGRALSKEEMLEAVWPGTFVEENNLAKYISRLRKLFNTDDQILIETLPKHGYRFSAAVSQILQPVGKTILEKRTTQRLTVRVEEDFGRTLPALPPKVERFSSKILLTILILIGLIAAIVLAWVWRRPKPVVVTRENGPVVLTDGRFDDNSAHWTNQGQIYFFRYLTRTRAESWSMNADGTNQHRANTEIKNLLNGRWSPDGTKVVFHKEGGSKSVYLANSDGSNEIALPFEVGNLDWSGDSSQFVYQSGALDKAEIFLYTLKTGKSAQLTNNNVLDADPSLSPDDKTIAFASMRDGNTEIYLMDTKGANVRRLTNHPAFENFPVFSPDGTQIAFQSNRENERTEIYLQNLNDDLPPRRITHSTTRTGLIPQCWSPDGTQILLWTDQSGKDQIILANVDPYPARPVLSSENEDLNSAHLAPDGKQLLYEARLANNKAEIRLMDLETKQTKTLFKSEAEHAGGSYLTPVWSLDGSRIAFVDKFAGNSEIFTIKADGSGLQRLTNDPLTDVDPIFAPDGQEIVFARDNYGTATLYRMNLDGSNQRRLTGKGGYEQSPAFSPDGNYLAFAGDRESHGLDIFLLNFKNPGDEKVLVARRFHERSPVFSPDGRKIAFNASSDGNTEIYLMNSDGTGLYRLTRNKAEDWVLEFSKDGKRVIFSSNRNGKFAIYEIELL